MRTTKASRTVRLALTRMQAERNSKVTMLLNSISSNAKAAQSAYTSAHCHGTIDAIDQLLQQAIAAKGMLLEQVALMEANRKIEEEFENEKETVKS